MDYEPYDSSGTDDDLPPSHQNRISGGGCVAGNGRSAMASVPHSRMYGETDMETQIHQLEQEAYSSVLRAFKAQADLITWEKESLITELRKELRLSNEEHKELLGRVNSDDVIRRIREWRQAAGIQPGLLSSCQAVHDSILSPTVSLSRKKQKVTQSVPSQSFGGPSPPFNPQAVAASHQPSSSTAKRGLVPVPKGKKQNHILPNTSSVKQYTSSGPPGRGQAVNRLSSNAIGTEPAEGSTFDSLIGRKVRTRWPDDNNFYEAVITDYNKTEGLHALIYDIGSSKETWEWVKLSEILPKDIQWVGEDTGISHCGGYSRSGHEMNRSVGHDNIPAAGRSRGVRKGQPRKDFLTSQNGIGKKVPDDIRIHRSVGHDSIPAAGRSRGVRKGQPRKDFLTSQNGVGKKVPDDIRIHNTDTLIKEVERVFGANHPDPLEIEKTKKVLKEHEQALIDAIAKLSNISDGGESGIFQSILCHSS